MLALHFSRANRCRLPFSGNTVARGDHRYACERVESERGVRQRSRDAVQVAPTTAEAAARFLLNLRVMRAAERLEGFATPVELDRLEQELDELMQSDDPGGEIVWTLRHAVFAAY